MRKKRDVVNQIRLEADRILAHAEMLCDLLCIPRSIELLGPRINPAVPDTSSPSARLSISKRLEIACKDPFAHVSRKTADTEEELAERYAKLAERVDFLEREIKRLS